MIAGERSEHAVQAVLKGTVDVAPEPEGAVELHLDEAGGPGRQHARGFQHLLNAYESPGDAQRRACHAVEGLGGCVRRVHEPERIGLFLGAPTVAACQFLMGAVGGLQTGGRTLR